MQRKSIHRCSRRPATAGKRVGGAVRVTEDGCVNTKRHGFTLIELLTVMVIITILAGVLIPVFHRVRTKGRRTKASTEALAMENAAKAFFLEYGHWPLSGSPGGTVFTSLQNGWSEVFQYVQVGSVMNPDRILFLQGDDFAVSGGSIMDPWGNPYILQIDLMYPSMTNHVQGAKGVDVWSRGPDGSNNTPDDVGRG